LRCSSPNWVKQSPWSYQFCPVLWFPKEPSFQFWTGFWWNLVWCGLETSSLNFLKTFNFVHFHKEFQVSHDNKVHFHLHHTQFLNLFVQLVHIIQDKDDIILIMYNQSNAITCIKCKAKLMVFQI
jgi:hypothetical protein